ncbi:Rv3212 family protein [Mycolicibacterium brumae]|uniref:PQQ-binding-like beta-propeller repeat protein n=1 Tax=Mycolicibacterium brumae TaxID=85968 RepID=A0A2G5PD07_9MYCO|nr:hypothetical protein [Mycolicibacterium brumae]MCV7193187.1 hypothetical protein [Mycolicibacterium brumae]PIB75903.1 hypothetical protein CQY22_007570 [Mycolicibacterium brumae]RWA16624.1 hypothetical protein MBRU_07825 [Mycolicibacterium brumae DSM 44177]UWW09842.1 hypothetical protein L2Z93_002958 [Mycolicibacterium brumae]
MVKPERRTRGDLIAVAAILAVIVVAAGLFWWTSDTRATDLRPAASPSSSTPKATAVPTSLRELWRAESPATLVPVIVKDNVITGAGSTMAGRDPATGEVRWSYARTDRPLCGVSYVYHWALAVYPDSRGCGQVSAISATTGERGPTRTSYADDRVTLSSDGSAALSFGDTRLEQWRSDLVRTIAFGELDARFKPVHVAVGKGCRLLSAAASSAVTAVLRDCPDSPGIRLTLLKAADNDDEPTERDVPYHALSADDGARVVAVSETTTAVYLPAPKPKLSIVDESGSEVGSLLLDQKPTSEPGPAAVSASGDYVTWWTGHSVIVMSSDTLTYKYAIPASGPDVPLGPGVIMAGRLLVPHTGGIGVYDPKTGAKERLIPVARPGSFPSIRPAVVGSTLIEQRGGTIVALG